MYKIRRHLIGDKLFFTFARRAKGLCYNRVFYIGIWVLLSCSDKDSQTITISACATKLSDGTIIEVECKNNSDSSLSKTHLFLKELDENHPAPKPYKVKFFYKAISATKEGTIKLENGVYVSFAGMQCSHADLKKYLDVFLVNDAEARIIYLPTGYTNKNIVYAYEVYS